MSYTPSDDVYVKSTSPNNNYNGMTALRLRLTSSETYTSYLRFNVTGVSSPITRAVVRLYVIDDSPQGGSIYSVADTYLNTSTPWVESGLTWNNAPTIGGAPLATVGQAALGTWVEFDVTAAITGDGAYSFGLNTSSTNSVLYNTKEAAANHPTLVIEFESGAPPAQQVESPLVVELPPPVAAPAHLTGYGECSTGTLTFYITAAEGDFSNVLYGVFGPTGTLVLAQFDTLLSGQTVIVPVGTVTTTGLYTLAADAEGFAISVDCVVPTVEPTLTPSSTPTAVEVLPTSTSASPFISGSGVCANGVLSYDIMPTSVDVQTLPYHVSSPHGVVDNNQLTGLVSGQPVRLEFSGIIVAGTYTLVVADNLLQVAIDCPAYIPSAPVTPTLVPSATPIAPMPLPVLEQFTDSGRWLPSGGWLFATDAQNGYWAVDTSVRGLVSVLQSEAQIDLTTAGVPRLTFRAQTALSSVDRVAVDLLPEGQVTWQTVFEMAGTLSDWTEYELDLSAYVGQRVWLRFRVDTSAILPENDTSTYFSLDALEISAVTTPTLTIEPTATPSATPTPEAISPPPTAVPTEVSPTATSTPTPTPTAVPTEVTPTATPSPTPTPEVVSPPPPPSEAGNGSSGS
ncbi:MAG: DNRLRE domain-containing protein [Chloroflexi bacterium]|uniref:CBM96 family carbohydrate-binding protein n=1 Tax=Candidatus Flexifilum breve TaxID=3140694 RepID=UPI003135D90D|nr:DNRLRE domain-containing protein [Chloroflexota bacterium]